MTNMGPKKAKRSLLCLCLAIIFVLSSSLSAFATVTPASLSATLNPGESVSETKTVAIPAMPPLADVVFAFDCTGSMYGIINTAKAQSVNIMTALDATGVDINYGVMSYMDYPGTYDSYGYYNVYGDAVAGDYAYNLDQAVTDNRTDVTSAINGLVIGSGGDGPQDYTRIFYESYADSGVNWRAGAKKIVINFGDNVPHDNNLEEGISAGTWSTGGDPGRDEIILNADDLDLQTVLAAMATNNVTLLECHTTNYSQSYWDYWTGLTGGDTYITTSGNLVADVVNAVTTALTSPTIDGLTLAASTGYEAWLTSVAPASYSGPTGVSTDFDIEITVPAGTDAGTYNFTIGAVDSAGVNYGSQTVAITVPEQKIEVSIYIKPFSCPNAINLDLKGVLPVAIFGQGDFDVAAIDASSIQIGGVSLAENKKGKLMFALEDVDGDGIMDAICHFQLSDLVAAGVLNADTKSLTLEGQLTSGQAFSGTGATTKIVTTP